MRAKPTSLGKRLAALAGGAVLACVAAEGLARLFDPGQAEKAVILDDDGSVYPLEEIIRYIREDFSADNTVASGARPGVACRICYDDPRWDYFDEDGCITLRVNSLGLRDDELPLAKPAGEHRVLAVGDSFTFGQGVQLEDSWPQVLERLLRAEGEAPVQVINAGFAGGRYWPPGYAPWLAEYGLQFEPDVVVLGLCLNDVSRKLPLAMQPAGVAKPWLGGRSVVLGRLQLWLADREREAFLRSLSAEDVKNAMTPYLVDGDWETTQEGLRSMRDTLSAAGVRFVVAILPLLTRLDLEYPSGHLHAAVREFCAAEGIEHVDLQARFQEHARSTPGYEDADLWVHTTDQHPNALAQGMIATAIHEQLNAP